MVSFQAKLLIQKDAPDFELPAAMPDDQTKTVSLKDLRSRKQHGQYISYNNPWRKPQRLRCWGLGLGCWGHERIRRTTRANT